MFTFFHGYLPEVWEAQIKRGLVGDNDGVRIIQTSNTSIDRQFNEIAKKGGALYDLILGQNLPMYVDRIQGGDYFYDYDFDKDLINDYSTALGEKFFGFQIHEWVSNYHTDVYYKLRFLPKWNEEKITKRILKKYPSRTNKVFLESMNAREMADYGKPKTAEKFFENVFSMYRKRSRVAELLPCDSRMLAYGFELQAGAKRLMPEVGAQTPNARIQICYARGMTRKKGKSFGIYYEPWGGVPFGACCYQKDQKNEWGIDENNDFPFRTYGDNGGSSRSLQRRIYLYAYLCGAEFMSEEWGLCNTFYDWNDFELSPYGLVKKEFLSFVKKYPDIGEKIVPAAVVLPKNLFVLDDVFDDRKICSFPCSHEITVAKRTVRELFAPKKHEKRLGTETTTFANSLIPDAIDILNEDDALLANYDFLIDATGDDAFSKRHKNIVDTDDIRSVLEQILPCYVHGKAHFVINKNKSGGYYLTVFNHEGVNRTVRDGETLLSKATIEVTVTFRSDVVPSLCEGNGTLQKADGGYRLTLPAGGWAFIRF